MLNENSLVYSVADIQSMLNVSRPTAYNFVNDAYQKGQPFKVLKIGKNLRIPKKDFDDWIKGNKAT